MKKLILALALIGLVSSVSLVKAHQAVSFATANQSMDESYDESQDEADESQDEADESDED